MLNISTINFNSLASLLPFLPFYWAQSNVTTVSTDRRISTNWGETLSRANIKTDFLIALHEWLYGCCWSVHWEVDGYDWTLSHAIYFYDEKIIFIDFYCYIFIKIFFLKKKPFKDYLIFCMSSVTTEWTPRCSEKNKAGFHFEREAFFGTWLCFLFTANYWKRTFSNTMNNLGEKAVDDETNCEIVMTKR